jgi:hypothetical protein
VQRVELALRIGDSKLDLDQAISCSLIVNDLVSNVREPVLSAGHLGRVFMRLVHWKTKIALVGPTGSGSRLFAFRYGNLTSLQLVEDLTSSR